MSTRTIEPIHIVLPDADGGYYRFGELPRLIAEALKPDTEEADADPHGDYYVFRALDQMNYEKDLPQAAALPPDAPGYLHVVENSASKRPLEWRMGAVLNAGLVHLDWLNEWGESRRPPLVFSTIAAPEPQAATPAPVADSASITPVVKTKAKRRTWWDVSSPYIVDVMRAGQYTTCKELYRALEAKAGPDSPFDKGTGVNRGSLFVREIARALDVKTVQNKWQKLRELAQK